MLEQVEEFAGLPQMVQEYEGSSAVDLGLSDVDENQKKSLENLLKEYTDVFSVGKHDIRHYQGMQHHICLKPGAVPVKQPLRRLPLAYQEHS